jgi:hypothetical protein
MVQLPDNIPLRMQRLAHDHRGFPVPWFVQWFDDNGEPCEYGYGTPDFRVFDGRKFGKAINQRRCWVCGEVLGRHRVFVIGPMCVVNRVTSEPANHRECAEWSAQACPFLSKPRMRRNDKDLPEEGKSPAGFHLDRNPGVVCLYQTDYAKPFRPQRGEKGVLFRLGDPVRVDWYAEGRTATRAEIEESISTGFPALERMAQLDGREAVAELYAMRDKAMKLLPQETPA